MWANKGTILCQDHPFAVFERLVESPVVRLGVGLKHCINLGFSPRSRQNYYGIDFPIKLDQTHHIG